MHNHDYELIMALAEGTLDPSAAAAARAKIETCQECAEDLALQLEGLQALQELPVAALTELESARLQRNLRQELGIGKQPETQSAARRRVPLAALATAAAVLTAVVVVGPGLNLIGGGDDASHSDLSEIGAAATTAAPAITAAPAGDLGMASPNVGGATDDMADRVSEEAATAPPTAAAAVTTTTTDGLVIEGAESFAFFGDESPDLEALRSELAAAEFDESAVRSNVLRLAGDSILEEDPGAARACVKVTLTSEENFVEGFQVARGLLGGREVLIVVYLAEDLEESELIMHAADNCEELGRAGP